jgi:hypothetical protein
MNIEPECILRGSIDGVFRGACVTTMQDENRCHRQMMRAHGAYLCDHDDYLCDELIREGKYLEIRARRY